MDLNQVGMWFADPADDDFCAGAPGIDGITPFDGDNEAGVQAFNSPTASPCPLPKPNTNPPAALESPTLERRCDGSTQTQATASIQRSVRVLDTERARA